MMFSINVFATVLVALVTCGVPAVANGQNLRERALSHAVRFPGERMTMVGPLNDYWAKPIEEVAREAVVVLRGKLVRVKSYLSTNEEHLLTDYLIQSPTVIAGNLPQVSAKVPGETAPLTLTVYGGNVVIEGVPVHAHSASIGPIADGGEYLLFLQEARTPAPGRYEIHYGAIFEISGDRVRPLLNQGEQIFKGTAGARVDDLILRIRAATHPR